MLFVCAGVSAQELTPRTYNNVPVGVNYIAFGYAFSTGNILLDPSLPIEGLDGDVNILFFRYTLSFALFGDNAKFTFFVPRAAGDWTGTVDGVFQTRKATGTGDVRFSLDWNFHGAPALNREQFASYTQGTVAGVSLLVIAPTGEYDEERLLNLGSNRWAFRPQIGVSWARRDWTLEALAAAWIYEDNNDFFDGNKLEQDELVAVKLHAIKTFRPGFWLGFGLGYGKGAQTFVNGEPKATEQTNWRLGATLAYPLRPNQGLVFSLVSAFNDGAGPEFNGIAVAYQYAWGGR